MFFNRYFLHTLLFLANLFITAQAYEAAVSYEKLYRLNRPAYKSSSGDIINFSYESDALKSEKRLDVFGMGDLKLYFQDKNAVNYSIQEAYARYQGDAYQVFVGRKILDWNINEKYWSLGYLNGNQAFTLLSTEEEGVTGILLKNETRNWEFDFLLSYVYVPSLNPAIDFKNGEVQSKSDWVRMPPKKTVVSGLEVPILYKKPDYKISKILFNKSLGGNIRYKWSPQGGVSAFAVYKPENRLRVNAGAFYDNTLGKVVVDADPTVNHHAYYGLQVYQAFGDVKARGGLSYVDPNAKLGKDFPVDITNARKTFKSEYFTINPRYEKEAYSHFSTNLDRASYALSLNYIHLLTKSTRGNDDFFSDSVKWKRAIGGSVLLKFTESFHMLLDLKYDLERYDNIINSEIRYNYQNKAIVAVGLEILKAPSEISYWSYYRANDMLYTSVGLFF